jgi:hypothetical protein
MNYLFFITPFTFTVLAVVFRLCISKNIPEWLTVSIGKINADDIRGMDNKQRNYLRKQVSYHFFTAVAVTLLISLIFFFLGNVEIVWHNIFCTAIELGLGLAIVFHVYKIAGVLKASMERIF